MKKQLIIPFIMVVSLILVRCGDVIEKNIGNSIVSVITPVNGYVSPSATIQLKWESVIGARNYRLQIVKPSFSLVKSFIIDSTISTTSFTYTFSPGNYQLRVRAQNASSSGPYSLISFSIDSSLNITNQIVMIRMPSDTVSNVAKQLFRWDIVPNAVDYRLEISGPTSVINANIKTDTITYLLSDGYYKCKIRAQNDNSVSQFTNFHFTIDTKAPDMPILLVPVNKAQVSIPVTFSWDIGTTGGSTIKDSLFIYSDSTLVNIQRRILTAAGSYSLNDTSLAKGTYFWRVKSFDSAGNKSLFSNKLSFILK